MHAGETRRARRAPRTLGYVRISVKKKQSTARQINALKGCCDRLYIERRSAAAASRPVFEDVLRRLQPGDTLAILDLDRAFRSTVDAIQEAERLRGRGVHLHIVNQRIDTATETGQVVYGILALLAEFERKTLIRRTKEGMASARRRGKHIGRPVKLSAADLDKARAMLEAPGATRASVARALGVHRTTLSRRLL